MNNKTHLQNKWFSKWKFNWFILLLVALLLFLFPSQAISEPVQIPKPNESVVKAIKVQGAKLYHQLLALRKDPEFLFRGFGDPKASKWNASVQQLHEDCSSELKKIPKQYWWDNVEFFDLCIASKRLQQIGLQYAMHEGADDKSSIIFKKEVETAFLTSEQ